MFPRSHRLPVTVVTALTALGLLAPAYYAAAAASSPSGQAESRTSAAGDDMTWSLSYRHNFSDLHDVSAMTSPKAVNSTLRSTDTDNSRLQKPSLASNVVSVADTAADDGKAMAVYTRRASYRTNSGTTFGWTNGRMALSARNEAPPVRIRARLKFTAAAHAKSAVMFWPAGGGWPWEVDFAESFGGKSTTDYWGGRQHISQRWHGDANGDGKAREQLIHDIGMDGTTYHVYDLFITPSRMWINVDDVLKFETTDTRFIPDSPGFFTVGKALTEVRGSSDRTQDAVLVDYLEIYKPCTSPDCDTGGGGGGGDGGPPSGVGVPKTPPVGYRPVFIDDFTGAGIDTSKWSVYNGKGNKHGPRCRENTIVGDGMLVLREAKKASGWCGAGVSSGRALKQQYGQYLVRMRFHKGYGVRAVALLWPIKHWPPEVDFFETEARDGDRSSTLIANHYGTRNSIQHAKVTADFSQWHTVGVTWTPSALTYTLDGVVTAVHRGHVPHETMWLGMQTGIGGKHHRPDSRTPSVVDFDVDWVAVYAPTS